MQKANRFRGATNQPPRTDEKVDRILKKGGPISFNGVTDNLKDPADNKQCERPAPLEKEQWPRDRDHRNPERMAEPVQRMPMLGFVGVDERSSHDDHFSQTSIRISIVPPQTIPSSLASSAVSEK